MLQDANETVLRRVTGPVTPEQLRYVDAFPGVRSALFMPVAGACFYALSKDHAHPGYMFVAPFDDHGRAVVGAEEISLLSGHVFALSPEILHTELPADGPPRYVALMIEPQLFEKEWDRYCQEPPMFRGVQFPRPKELLPLVRGYMCESKSDSPGRLAVLEALEVELCHALIRGVLGEPASKEPASERLRIGGAIEAIHARLAEKLTIDELAGAAGLSTTHFRRVFARETGLSPVEYLRRTRLERAKKLIAARDLTLTEVALECGLGSSAYLCATFSKLFGLSPAAYRLLLTDGRSSQKKGRKTKA
ncbi:putative HTH-type transcriptional regulator [Geobacter sp. OR-1]|uniref:AraC family transcriptional regulator n=1 Tax=Geobacter sp. OR-1 TaxID=1266765 RepID=UPI000541EC12|nr:AraC family transcriptional regulator [Geobacter sp. OR-1]GAM08493.1 putative HTH-type transcriptional regulator [Geobacter sp. OR-1]